MTTMGTIIILVLFILLGLYIGGKKSIQGGSLDPKDSGTTTIERNK